MDGKNPTPGFGEIDKHLMAEGTHTGLYRRLGAHEGLLKGEKGVFFSVWAPEAARVTVMGDFCDWNRDTHPLSPIDDTGVWQGFVPGVKKGALYKYWVESRHLGYEVEKADPFARLYELAPKTASIVWSDDYQWNDAQWLERRKKSSSRHEPMSIYELHLGSWRRSGPGSDEFLDYDSLAKELVPFLVEMGFTHVEMMPVTEHPFYGSWGYQTTGYFAPSCRFGKPDGLKRFIDALHQAGIAVILDWVPSHFPTDQHGLAYFDGSHLYEHADPRRGYHPDWNSAIFNYGRHEVRSFLLSSAFYWLEEFHIDGLRVDAVASMLYLDYSRKPGEWIPNVYGGHENLEAMLFLRTMNQMVHERYPGVVTIAEESTAWPKVSRPVEEGGLGFDYKWDMGWMHDTLRYLAREPVHRSFHHNELTFRGMYAFSENYVMPLSHDEVVHGKGSLLRKMPGDDWQRFANLRLLYSYMYALPGKKLLFMGAELAQGSEWNHEQSLDWHLLEFGRHGGIKNCLKDLNRIYKETPALYSSDCAPEGFEWVDCDDSQRSVLSFLRKGQELGDVILAVFNFTPVPREDHLIGVPVAGEWTELFNSDSQLYGGSGVGNLGGKTSEPISSHGHGQSLRLTIPPLGALFLSCQVETEE